MGGWWFVAMAWAGARGGGCPHLLVFSVFPVLMSFGVAGLPAPEDTELSRSLPPAILSESLEHGEGGTYSVQGNQHVVFPLRGGYLISYRVTVDEGNGVNVHFINQSAYASYKHGGSLPPVSGAAARGHVNVLEAHGETKKLSDGRWFMVVDAKRANGRDSNFTVSGRRDNTFQKLLAHGNKDEERRTTFSVELQQEHPSVDHKAALPGPHRVIGVVLMMCGGVMGFLVWGPHFMKWRYNRYES